MSIFEVSGVTFTGWCLLTESPGSPHSVCFFCIAYIFLLAEKSHVFYARQLKTVEKERCPVYISKYGQISNTQLVPQ